MAEEAEELFYVQESDIDQCTTPRQTLNHKKFRQLLRIYEKRSGIKMTIQDLIRDDMKRGEFELGVDSVPMRYDCTIEGAWKLTNIMDSLDAVFEQIDEIVNIGGGDDDISALLAKPYTEILNIRNPESESYDDDEDEEE